MIRRKFILLWAAPALAQPPFTTQLWESIALIYQRILKHPFLTGLTDGTLPQDRFRYYIVQDTLYLRAFGQALNILASKAPRQDWAITLAQHSIDAIKSERELHDRILVSLAIKPEEAARSAMGPANRAYTDHLLASVTRLSFVEGLGAMLPCYWIYGEVGKELKKKGSPSPLYQRWIDQYSAEEYGKTVKEVLDMMNVSAPLASAGERYSAKELFVLSSRYEYMFWDMAWKTEQWPP